MTDRRRSNRPDYTTVWVVEMGERNEGGSVVGIRRRRTQARVLKADIQRGAWFYHEVDWCTIRKMKVIDGRVDI